MRQTRNTAPATPSATVANTVAPATPAPAAPPARTAARAAVKPATTKAAKAALALKKAIKPPSIKAALAAPTNPLMAQFVRDMAVAGHGDGTQATYLGAVQQFIIATWTSPAEATEAQLQSYLIALRQRDVAGETFRVQRFALQFLFQNTLARDWPLFKKN
jgi:hypothetical protein